MLLTDNNGAAAAAGVGRMASTVWVILDSSGCRHPRKRVTQYSRDARVQPRSRGVLEPPLSRGMTCALSRLLPGSNLSPPQPLRLARQLDGLDLLQLDGALAHEVVEIAVGGARDLHAIEVDLQRAAMILLGPGRGVADAFHARRHPVLLLVKALGDVLAGGAAVLGRPVERFAGVECGTDAGDVVHRAVRLAGRIGHFR